MDIRASDAKSVCELKIHHTPPPQQMGRRWITTTTGEERNHSAGGTLSTAKDTKQGQKNLGRVCDLGYVPLIFTYYLPLPFLPTGSASVVTVASSPAGSAASSTVGSTFTTLGNK